MPDELLDHAVSVEDGSFSTTGWPVTHFVRCWALRPRTQTESFAEERPEVVVTAVGIRAADARDALEIVTARRKALAGLLDTLKAESTVGGGALLIIVLAEDCEVLLDYRVDLLPLRETSFFVTVVAQAFDDVHEWLT